MEKFKTADFHQDTLNPILAKILNNPELRHAEKRACQLPREGLRKIDLIFSSVYRRINAEQKGNAMTGDANMQEPIKADYNTIIDYYHDTKDFNIIEKPEDLGLRQPDQTNAILHMECGDIITDPDVVNELYARGVRSIGLMYSHDNHIGGGAGGDKNRGLTAEGKRIIDRMVELGMVIDVAHANRKTAQDILDRVRNYKKVAATHTGFGEVKMPIMAEERFVTPRLMQEIAARGGVIGLNVAKPFFPTLKDYVDSMKKASDITGSTENLAIATDFGGLDADHLYEELDEIGKLGIVAEKLSEEGNFSDEDIARIMYGNIERLVLQL